MNLLLKLTSHYYVVSMLNKHFDGTDLTSFSRGALTESTWGELGFDTVNPRGSSSFPSRLKFVEVRRF